MKEDEREVLAHIVQNIDEQEIFLEFVFNIARIPIIKLPIEKSVPKKITDVSKGVADIIINQPIKPKIKQIIAISFPLFLLFFKS